MNLREVQLFSFVYGKCKAKKLSTPSTGGVHPPKTLLTPLQTPTLASIRGVKSSYTTDGMHVILI